MGVQYGEASRNGMLNALETAKGASPVLSLRTGPPPANCAAADSGSLLGTATLPSDHMADASGGVKSKAGTWSGTASAGGTVGHYRIKTAGGTCEEQGTCGQSVSIATSSTTSANGNVLNHAATTGVVAGMNVSGTGIAAGTKVVSVTSTTVTLDRTSTAGVSSAVSITYSYDMVIDNAVLANLQTFTVTSFQQTAGNA